jgi:hypothetical protein
MVADASLEMCSTNSFLARLLTKFPNELRSETHARFEVSQILRAAHPFVPVALDKVLHDQSEKRQRINRPLFQEHFLHALINAAMLGMHERDYPLADQNWSKMAFTFES